MVKLNTVPQLAMVLLLVVIVILVAPVTVGNYSYVGAGSTITKDVPDKALAVGRSKQIVKENWVTEDTFKKK